MSPEVAAAIHAAAFAPSRGWSAAEIKSLLASPGVCLHAGQRAFALTRSLAGEAELLTLAVAPDAQRQGQATALLRHWLQSETAETAFLEVAADNLPARALYARFGFAETARRPAYYARPGAQAVDAVLMRAELTHGQPPD